MATIFLTLFTIAAVAAYLAYQSQEEIVQLFSTIFAAISLLLSFAWAPWIMQILILVAGLGGIRYFCYRHSCQNTIKNK